MVVIKSIILAVIIAYIILKLNNPENFNPAIRNEIIKNFHANFFLLLIIILLMPVNWLFEALKWKLLSHKIVKLSWWQAYQGVLSGLSLSFITPHAIGDYAGRILMIKTHDRPRLIGALLVSRMFQMIPTLLAGVAGIYYLFGMRTTVFYFVACGSLVGMLLFLKIFPARYLPQKLAGKMAYYLGIIRHFDFKVLLKTLLLSFSRYTIFLVQFYLVLHVFTEIKDMKLWLSGITWVFLAKSVLPTFNFLSDLGVREFSAIYFFENFEADIVPVVTASLVLWIINILAPTVIGMPLIYKLR